MARQHPHGLAGSNVGTAHTRGPQLSLHVDHAIWVEAATAHTPRTDQLLEADNWR